VIRYQSRYSITSTELLQEYNFALNQSQPFARVVEKNDTQSSDVAATDELQREANLKDKDEIDKKRQEYQDFMDWKDRGILFDLKDRFQIVNPTLSLLLPIALNMSTFINVPLGL
jgi:hypothetical protein